jgi:Coat F domain.
MATIQDITAIMGDKEILQDSLQSQKHISDGYNLFAGECVNEALRTEMLSILGEEHRIQADIFCNLQSKGWYKVEAAEQTKIDEVKQQFSQTP